MKCVNKIKITQKEWEYIRNYNYAKKWARKFCNYFLIKESDGFCLVQKIGIIFYLLTFIPFMILYFFYYCWNEGLKELTFPERTLGVTRSYDKNKAEEIWGKYKNN